MSASNIEWTDATWNPVTGCTKVSQGCKNCYAEGVANRFWAKQYPLVDGRPRRFTDVQFHPERLDEPLKWKKPRRVFVNSMSDLFHESLSGHEIAQVFGRMHHANKHTYQVLTKRPERMLRWTKWFNEEWLRGFNAFPREYQHVWLGVSVEDQQTADDRIPLLLQTPAAVRFVSYEPALGPVDFKGLIQRRCVSPSHPFPFLCDRSDHDLRGIDWIIVGGESGPGARPCDVAWIESTITQCKAAGVACFVKQLGAQPYDSTVGIREADRWAVRGHRSRKGGIPEEWPEDLRVREFPR